MKTCISCGMPLEGEHADQLGIQTADGSVCINDCMNGDMKEPEEIFEGGVQFFLSVTGGEDRALAERLTRKNMNSLDYWKSHPAEILNGPTATDEEFHAVMSKL